MIKITFFKNKEFLIGFEISGHSGYAERGSDIVCAAVSSMTQMAVVGLEKILKLKVNVRKDEKNGYLICKLSKQLNEIVKAQEILNTLKISLKDIVEDYKKYLSMEVKDEID